MVINFGSQDRAEREIKAMNIKIGYPNEAGTLRLANPSPSINFGLLGEQVSNIRGNKAILRGVNYANIRIGQMQPNELVEFEQLIIDFAEMKEMGADFVRLYYDSNWTDEQIQMLDELARTDNLRLMILVWVNYNTDFTNETTRRNIVSNFVTICQRLEQHTSICAIGISSENNLYTQNKRELYSLVNESIRQAKTVNNNVKYYHSSAEFADVVANDNVMPDVDWHGVTCYRTTQNAINAINTQYTSNKPLIITEYGVNTLDNTESTQATELVNQSNWFANLDKVIAITLFQWVDGWHKSGNPSVQDNHREEHWGITHNISTTQSRNKKQAYQAIKNNWNNI